MIRGDADTKSGLVQNDFANVRTSLVHSEHHLMGYQFPSRWLKLKP